MSQGRIRARWGFGSIVSLILCLGAFIALSAALDLWWLLWVPLVYFVGMSLAISRSAVVRAYEAQLADPVRHHALLNQVSYAARRMNVPMPAVYVSPIPAANALSLHDRRGGMVLFHQVMVDTFPVDEMLAVVAHEVAHLKNRDTPFKAFLLAVQEALTHVLAVGAVIVTVAVAVCTAIFSRSAGRVFGYMTAIVTAAVAAFGGLAARLLVSAGSRSREYMADRVAADVLPDPLSLSRALQRLDSAERRWNVGELPTAVASLSIVQPFAPSLAAGLVASHPSIRSRVRRLERLVGSAAAVESYAIAARQDQERRDAERRRIMEEATSRHPVAFTNRPPFDPFSGELFWGAFPARIVKQRTRGGESFMEPGTTGTAYFTTHRVAFYGDSRTEWRWDKIHDYGWEFGVLGGDAVVMAVTNRQVPSGLLFAAQSAPGARRLMNLALAVAEGRRNEYIADLAAGRVRL